MKKYIIYTLFVLLTLSGCKDFLEVKPRKGLVVPRTLNDLQAFLEKESESQRDPSWGEISTDDFYYEDSELAGKSEIERNVYLWDKGNVFGTDQVTEWLSSYRMVYHCNLALEGLQKIERNAFNAALWDKVKGEALFFRAKRHLAVASIWALAYDPQMAATTPGIPLRLNTDFNQPSSRGSLEQTYAQVIRDLKASLDDLPVQSAHPVRPSRAAAMALLARTYLFMGDYQQCLYYADACLKLKSNLMEYSSLSLTAAYPMPIFNPEVIHHSFMLVSFNNPKIPDTLYNSFNENDLRKSLFFKSLTTNVFGFKGSYDGSAKLFSGIATDEVYLMRAECLARTGKRFEALQELNTLVKTRWRKDQFIPFQAGTDAEALQLILAERRKQLLFRATRWPDVKRLNVAGAGISMSRTNGATQIWLAPGDPRFALPIPQGVIDVSGIEQNKR